MLEALQLYIPLCSISATIMVMVLTYKLPLSAGAETGTSTLTGPVHPTTGGTELLTEQVRTACWPTPTTGASSATTIGGSTGREGGGREGRVGRREDGKEGGSDKSKSKLDVD